jgi:hypothetical protein
MQTLTCSPGCTQIPAFTSFFCTFSDAKLTLGIVNNDGGIMKKIGFLFLILAGFVIGFNSVEAINLFMCCRMECEQYFICSDGTFGITYTTNTSGFGDGCPTMSTPAPPPGCSNVGDNYCMARWVFCFPNHP